MAEYGIPYMGSKGSICSDLVKLFPAAENFYANNIAFKMLIKKE